MGTRADFYVGKDQKADWIGSIAWDGYREGIDDTILRAHSEEDFRKAVAAFFAHDREDVTTPEMGWPWPWDSSRTSDCAYFFFDGRVWDAKLGPREFDVYAPCDEAEPEYDSPDYKSWLTSREPIKYPDMSARRKVTLGPRSGLITFGV